MKNRSQRLQLLRNISLTLLGLFLFHAAVFGLISVLLKLSPGDFLAFGAILFIHHLLIMLILANMLEFFVYDRGGKPLNRVNLPIFITLIRITSLPSIIYLIMLKPRYPVLIPLIIYTVFAFISDFLDGNISRRTHQTTKIGAYLDSMSDYAVLIAISIAYIIYNLLPVWFFVLVMFRLFFQWAAAGVLSILHQKITPHHSSWLAKASIFLIMLMYAAALLQFIPAVRDIFPLIIRIFEWTVSPVIVISLIEKVAGFVLELKSVPLGDDVKEPENGESGNTGDDIR